MFENSDDYDFTPAESSKLASLFGTSPLSTGSLNSSLKYTAPKQPTPSNSKKNEPVSKPQTTVVLAKVVLLWKLEDKDYKALGKHGLAIIGSEDLKIYEIIAYKEKNNVILKTKVSSDFHFYTQQDKFSSFYDSDSKNWLIKFENEDQKEFSSVIEKCGAQIVVSVVQGDCSKPDLLPKPTPNSDDQNSDSSASRKRSNILNRMAKMGQQILPRHLVRNTSTDVSDTELEEDKNERKFTRKMPKKLSDSEKQVVPVNSSSSDNSLIFAAAQTANPDIFSHFIVSQNTDLKMHLSQLTAKLDSVLMGRSTPPDTNAQSKIKALQLKLENQEAHLKAYKEKYEALSSKDNKNEMKLEELSVLRTRLLELEKQLQDFEATKKSLECCQECIRMKERLIDVQEVKLLEYEMMNKNQQATINSLTETVDELRKQFKESEEKHTRDGTEERAGQILRTVKANMSDMYASILENLEGEKSYSYAEVQSVIAKYLKTTTFKIVEALNGTHRIDVNISPTDSQPQN